MSGKNFLFGKYSFIKKYAVEKTFSKTDISVSFFSTNSLWKIDILAIISASKALLWRPDFLCVSIASDLNRSDATPENFSVLLWGFVTPCFLQMIQNIPSPSTWQSHQLSMFSTQPWLNFLGLILCNSCPVIFEHLLKQV